MLYLNVLLVFMWVSLVLVCFLLHVLQKHAWRWLGCAKMRLGVNPPVFQSADEAIDESIVKPHTVSYYI